MGDHDRLETAIIIAWSAHATLTTTAFDRSITLRALPQSPQYARSDED
jgi:hypothetical protein